MYTLLALFFISLLSIIFMIGKKIILIRTGEVVVREDFVFEIPFLKEVKHLTLKNLKILGHKSLVATIRVYVKSSNFLKNKYQEIRERVKDKIGGAGHLAEKKEISKFLKIISDYKRKIRDIKHKIHEEEKQGQDL